MNLHLIAVICVLIAFILYATSAALGTAFGILGLIFELIALVSIIKANKNKEKK